MYNVWYQSAQGCTVLAWTLGSQRFASAGTRSARAQRPGAYQSQGACRDPVRGTGPALKYRLLPARTN